MPAVKGHTGLAHHIASALVGASRALLAARPDLRGPILGMTDSLLATGMLAGSGVITSAHLGFRRRSCCLFYQVPGRNVCGDCMSRRARRPSRG